MSENQSNGVDDAYFDRSQAVQLMARMASLLGWRVGVLRDPQEPEWPVLVVDLEAGQVTWHIKANELMGEWPTYPGKWDGHDLAEKRRRMAEDIEGLGQFISDMGGINAY